MKKNTFIQGTLVSSILLIIIKILGALYVIPFYKIIGEGGGTLYSYAYNIYTLFLNISSAGIPVAMSMIISEYLALEMYDAKERAKKVGTKVITLLSFISFFIVFFGSSYFARFLLSDMEGGHTVSEVSLVIKVTSFCLLIIPFLSIIRGYMQGHKFVTVTSFSQVIEQIVRIIVVLLGSYVSIKLLNKSVEIGVAVALTGAFFGGLIAYIYLRIKIKNNEKLFKKSTKEDNVDNKTILKKIISYCIPIVMIAIIDNIYSLVDIKLIVKGLNMVGYTTLQAQTISGIVATWAPKICTIIIAISISLITNIIPHVTSSYAKKDYKEVNKKINQAISTMLIITFPMCVLLILLSKEAYYIFYGTSEFGPLILCFSALCHLFLGVWSVFNSILQSLKKFKIIYINAVTGLAINTLLDIPMIFLLSKLGLPPFFGTIIATCIGYSISISIVTIYLRKHMNFNFSGTFNVLKKIIIPIILIILVIGTLKYFIKVDCNLLTSFISLFIYGIIGVSIYAFITYRNKAIQDVFGDSFVDKILNKFKKH